MYSKYGETLKEGELLFLEGTINHKKNEPSFVVDKLIAIDKLSEKRKQRVYLRVEGKDKQTTLSKLKQLLEQYPGQAEVIYHDPETKKTIRLPEAYFIQVTDESLFELEILLGKKNVIVK